MIEKVQEPNPVYENINTDAQRTIVIGDIHGCYDELQKLLKKVEFNSSDILVAVGDLVDRGADSWKVVDFFKNTKNAYSALGNHERKIAGVVRGTIDPSWTQSHTLSKLSKNKHSSYADYFETLPAIIETPHAIITHARLDPSKSINEQEAYHTCGVGGESVKIIMDENGIPLWFHEFKDKNGVIKPICIGHKNYNRVELENNGLYALDTEAAKGNQLTAIVLPELNILSIDCHNYFDESLDEWRTQDFEYKYNNMHLLPLSVIFKMLEKEEHNEYELKLIDKFNSLLKEYDFEEKTTLLRKQFLSKFGKLPDDGPSKGEYFKNIHALMEDNVNQRLVNFILSGKSYNFNKLSSLYQKKSLEEISIQYASIYNWLNTLKL